LKLQNVPETDKELIDQALADLQKTFATLTQEEQKYANMFLHDIQSGDAAAEEGKTLRDYITEYQVRAKDSQIHRISTAFGLDEKLLREMMNLRLTERTINEYGRFDLLKGTVDREKARAYFEKRDGGSVPPFKANIPVDGALRRFLAGGEFDGE
jgi:type I restriction enzyme R subunit